MDIFKWLDDSTLVKTYVIFESRNTDFERYLSLRIDFIDSSELHVRIFLTKTHRKYSFQWQKISGELIMRWDNAPHFKSISTYPHHKHSASGVVEESHDISFEDVMEYIKLNLDSHFYKS